MTEPGGFDCSGFVWRVYKTKPFPGAPTLGDILKGRTTYAMSAEIPKPARIDLAGLQPGDVVFFGAQGPKSTPGEVGHMGVYVGNGWFVHSSSAGLTLQPLQGWYAKTFAQARRPLSRPGSRPRGELRSSHAVLHWRGCCLVAFGNQHFAAARENRASSSPVDLPLGPLLDATSPTAPAASMPGMSACVRLSISPVSTAWFAHTPA